MFCFLHILYDVEGIIFLKIDFPKTIQRKSLSGVIPIFYHQQLIAAIWRQMSFRGTHVYQGALLHRNLSLMRYTYLGLDSCFNPLAVIQNKYIIIYKILNFNTFQKNF